jgi:hypothetical protein
MALIVALSRGGKVGLAAPPGEVLEGKVPGGPAPSPATDLGLRQPDGGGGFTVADMRELIKEQGQAGPLNEAIRRGPTADGVTGVLQERLGELRAV